MAILHSRIKRIFIKAIFIWIVISSFYGTEVKCCEIQTLLCDYPKPTNGCSPLCFCTINSRVGPEFVICDGVLLVNELPLEQFQLNIAAVTITNNNIGTIKNKTFFGLFADILILNKNKINTIEASAFAGMDITILDLSDNLITVIEKWTFDNLPRLTSLNLTNNLITDFGPQTFMSLPKLNYLSLANNRIKTIGPSTFVNITNLQYLLLYKNPIDEIQEHAFQNLLNVSNLIMRDCPVKKLKSYAFSSIRSIEIAINSALLEHIEPNAIYNTTSTILELGISEDLSFEENFIGSHFNQLYLSYNPYSYSVNCNCKMIWIALWLEDKQNRRSFVGNPLCNDPENTPVRNLTMESFSKCREIPDSYECREKEAVIMNCTLSFVSGKFIKWIHSRNGTHIRTLKTLNNILSIPHCSPDDIGDYTCVRSTLYYAAPYINLTTTLYVKGKPVIINRQSYESDEDLVLSVTIQTTDDAVDIQWYHGSINLSNDAGYMIRNSVVPLRITQYNTPVVVEGLMTNLTIRNYNSLFTKAYTCRISNDIGTVEEVLLTRPIDIILQPNTVCNTSSKLKIDCTLNADGATPKYFKHSVGGKLIRTLTGSRVNNTYTLVIPFCNSQDLGDYTCYWETVVPGFEVVFKPTTLAVLGPPIILYHTETVVDGFVILSVMFLSNPYPMEPQWFSNDVAIVPSSDIQQTTSISTVEMQLHRVIAYVNGFISNLTIKEGRAGLGHYKCVVTNGYGTSERIITRYKGPPTSSRTADGQLPIILGSVAAGVAIIIIAMVVFVKRKTEKTKRSNTYIEPTDKSSNGSDTYDTIDMPSTTTGHYNNYIDK